MVIPSEMLQKLVLNLSLERDRAQSILLERLGEQAELGCKVL